MRSTCHCAVAVRRAARDGRDVGRRRCTPATAPGGLHHAHLARRVRARSGPPARSRRRAPGRRPSRCARRRRRGGSAARPRWRRQVVRRVEVGDLLAARRPAPRRPAPRLLGRELPGARDVRDPQASAAPGARRRGSTAGPPSSRRRAPASRRSPRRPPAPPAPTSAPSASRRIVVAGVHQYASAPAATPASSTPTRTSRARRRAASPVGAGRCAPARLTSRVAGRRLWSRRVAVDRGSGGRPAGPARSTVGAVGRSGSAGRPGSARASTGGLDGRALGLGCGARRGRQDRGQAVLVLLLLGHDSSGGPSGTAVTTARFW